MTVPQTLPCCSAADSDFDCRGGSWYSWKSLALQDLRNKMGEIKLRNQERIVYGPNAVPQPTSKSQQTYVERMANK